MANHPGRPTGALLSQHLPAGRRPHRNWRTCWRPSNQVRYSVKYRSRAMTPEDFRRIALSLEGVEEVSHAGLPAFRVGAKRFASLASQAEGYGNLTLTLEHQVAF